MPPFLTSDQSWLDIAQLSLLAIGGAAAFWKWGLGEWRAGKREVPTLSTSAMLTKIGNAGQAYLYSIKLHIKNPGLLPVHVNCAESIVDLYVIPDTHQTLGRVPLSDDWLQSREGLFAEGMTTIEYEPNTEDCFEIPLIAPKGSNCVVEINISLRNVKVLSTKADDDTYISHNQILLLRTD